MKKGVIFDIQKFSIHDGPGIAVARKVCTTAAGRFFRRCAQGMSISQAKYK